MFEKLGGFKISGGFFETPKNLMPFKRELHKKADGTLALREVVHYSIIYGVNGSGKSSITRAFYGYANESEAIEKIQLLDNDEKEIDFSTVKKQIFVFNENFIKDHINFSESANLEAVVSFGEQKELDEQIAEIRKEIIELEEKIIPAQTGKVEQAKKEAGATRKKIANHLRNNCAERDRNIQKLTKDVRHAPPVSESKLASYFQNKIEKEETTEYLLSQYVEQFEALKKLKDSVSIEAEVPKVKFSQDIDAQIKALLVHSVEKPIFTEREQKIQALIEADPSKHQINDAYKYFLEGKGESCPFCLQEVSDNYKQSLLNAIRNVLDSEKAKIHRTKIEKFIETSLQKIEINLRPFEAHFQDDVNSIKLEISSYNESIALAIKNLEQKARNIYHPIKNIETDLLSQQKNIDESLKQLDSKYNSLNDTIKKKKEAIRELNEINAKLAQRENEERYKNLLELEKLQEDAAENMTLSIQKLNEKTVLIQNLNAEKKNIKFAASKMNRYLAYIFLAHDRLKLVVDDGHYAVEVRGHRIKLKDLSEGEKNAIALCYFFLKIQADKDEQHQFEEKLFIVLDDPISSFDYYNKVGIFSFLRMMIAAIKNGNENSKILIFTHQVESVFHLEKLKSDSIQALNIKCWTLSKKKLISFSHNCENEYSLLFKEVYCYATQGEGYEKMEYTIGNAIRRVIEGFATFFYRQSTEMLTRNNEVLQRIDKKYQPYYESLMYRLSLNSDSHLSYQARHATETEFYSLISQDEKIKLAKSLLFFLCSIDELHVIAHLSPAKEKVELDSRKQVNIIRSWEKELFGEDAKTDSTMSLLL